jgi:uncharacterized protein (TIGR03118 family)
MSYFQYNDYYRILLRTGRLPIPYPYYYPYLSPAPNLSNDSGCRSHYYGSLPYDCDYDYGPGLDPDPYIDPCIDPFSFNNNLCYNQRNLCEEKYDYHCYDKIPFQDPSLALGFTIQKLVSNIPKTAKYLDIGLLVPWGVIVLDDIVWVVNSATGLLVSYDLCGKPILPIVNIFGPVGNIAQPTGIAFNDNIDSFVVVKGPLRGPSYLIISTRDGTINGYNNNVDPCNAILLIDNSANNSIYTGLEVGITPVSNISNKRSDRPIIRSIRSNIYVADFYNQRVDVFDGALKRITTCPFIDENTNDPIPEDYAPYNIVNIGDFLYVTYARQNPDDNQYELSGSGFGFISIFTFEGLFVKRFVSRGSLNAPWGLVLAPSSFGYPAGSIMVANYGDGTINIFDSEGKCVGPLRDSSNNVYCLGGLRGLSLNPNYAKIVYWTSNENFLRDAYMGSINICPNP